MSQELLYERGKHEPDFSMVERISAALDVPESYFYAKDDDAARLLVAFHRLGQDGRARILDAAEASRTSPLPDSAGRPT